jgi:hypothetical protein
VTSLPVLKRVSSLPTNTLDRMLLTHMLSEMKYRGSVCRSQRDYAEIFNRIDSARFSRSRRLLEKEGWVFRSSLSVGHASDCYERGKCFDGEPYLLRNWLSLAHNLWSHDGLLFKWSGSPGWGHGCLGVSGMFVLATVERADCMLSHKQISDYSEMFCSKRSVKGSIERLVDIGVFIETVDGVGLSDHWNERFNGFVASSDAGAVRFKKGNENRKNDRLKRRQTVERGLLTDAERGQLRSLRCWVSGCRTKSKQADHFPPMRFLDLFKDKWSPHILFSACRKHNVGFGNFIASLPDLNPERRQCVFTDGVDPWRLFRASNNLSLVKFKKHADDKNLAAASAVVKRSLDLFYSLQIDDLASKRRSLSPMDKSRTRRRKGSAVVNKKTTFESQIYGGI